MSFIRIFIKRLQKRGQVSVFSEISLCLLFECQKGTGNQIGAVRVDRQYRLPRIMASLLTCFSSRPMQLMFFSWSTSAKVVVVVLILVVGLAVKLGYYSI